MEDTVVFFSRYLGFSPEYVMSLTPGQIKHYMSATSKLLSMENGGEKGSGIADEEQAKKIADANLERLKKKRGPNYKPSLLDLAGTGVI